jgi:hypothetical protein
MTGLKLTIFAILAGVMSVTAPIGIRTEEDAPIRKLGQPSG